MSRSGKVWGSTEFLLMNPFVELHRIEVVANAQCSLHKHEFKSNLFLVLTGRLKIEVHKNDYALVDETVLGPGEFTVVAPNEFHRFVSLEATTALEIYFPQGIGHDIVRKDCGALIGPHKGDVWASIREAEAAHAAAGNSK